MSEDSQSTPRHLVLRFLPLSEPMFLILSVLRSEQLHGYGILQAIESLTHGRKRLRTGTLYNALGRLQRQELIDSIDGEDPSDSRRSKSYSATALGREVFEAEADRLRSLVALSDSTSSIAP